MSTTPRLPSALPGRDADFGTLIAHQPELAGAFQLAYGTFWSHGVLDQATKEVARMRNARITDCGFCRNVRFAGARAEGLSESMVEAIDDGYESSDLDARQKVVLRYADRFLGADGPPDESLQRDLDRELSAAEQQELGIGLAMFHGFAKLLIALGCEPDQMDTTVLPTPDIPQPVSG